MKPTPEIALILTQKALKTKLGTLLRAFGATEDDPIILVYDVAEATLTRFPFYRSTFQGDDPGEPTGQIAISETYRPIIAQAVGGFEQIEYILIGGTGKRAATEVAYKMRNSQAIHPKLIQ